MAAAWALALLAWALQWDLPLGLGPWTVHHNELALAALALGSPLLAGDGWLRRARTWALAGAPLLLWLLAHAPSVGWGEALKGALRAAQFLLALALPALWLRQPGPRALVWRALFAAAGFTALWGLAQSVAGPGHALNAGREMELIHGFQAAGAGFRHHNQLGAFLAAVSAAAGACLLAGRQRAWAATALVLGAVGLACSYSRGAWLGAALAASALALALTWRRRLGLLATVLALLWAAWAWPGGAFRDRLKTLAADSERDAHRAALLEAGQGHGLWGLGPAGLDRAVQASATSLGQGRPHPAFSSHSHNSWLQWGLTWGWPVLLLWVLALAPAWAGLKDGWRKGRPWALGLLGCLAAFGLQAWTDHLFLHARGAAVALVWGLLLAELNAAREAA